MTYVVELVYRVDLHHVGLVVHEISIGFDGCLHRLEVGTILKLHIHHAAMYAGSYRYGHRQCVAYAWYGTHSNRVTHRATRAEVGVADAARCKTLHQSAHDGVAARIPSGTDDAHDAVLLGYGVEGATEVDDAGVDVERVDGIDAHSKALLGILLNLACGSGEYGNIYLTQFTDVGHYGVSADGAFAHLAAHDACTLHVGGCLDGFEGITANVAVTYDCNSCHNVLFCVCWVCEMM